MYPAGALRDLLGWRRRAGPPTRGLWLGSNIVFLGLTSLVTDISSEMVAAVLPIYLVYTLELSPLSLGVIDGLYHAAAVLVRVAAGLAADRLRRVKEVAGVGYALSALCKLGFLVASAAPVLAALVVIDRTGKGIRTAPRDALISASAPPGALASAFGVHRALDTAGAMLGPLVAFGLLWLAPGRFDVIFVVSFCIAVIGVALFALLVQPKSPASPAESAHVSALDALRLLRRPAFARLCVVGSSLAAVTLSDGLLYLVLHRRVGFPIRWLPLLYVGSALVFASLAVPVGRVADRIGRERVFLAGYLALAVLYAVVLLGPRSWGTVACAMALLGASYAATDGVLMAMAGPELPDAVRTTGFAVLTTFTSLARLSSSVIFGAIWAWWGTDRALLVFVGAVLVATMCAAALWSPRLRGKHV